MDSRPAPFSLDRCSDCGLRELLRPDAPKGNVSDVEAQRAGMDLRLCFRDDPVWSPKPREQVARG